ncbi:NAD(P)-binding protein [Gonapodya prolifera JEL478]|uniref:NAD(P)-binding protein n=1 Tax=Gonapodya prolifera (strain JEL478) TaxID=1344416 RepID=A0A139APJ0_GONPJ|nr:NAD(P)-binding protein [Gonapodya prolifera JEL478]|eukprot:KXS18405.1 NAD(P)-binding protein [Gonapodya prolifera JEL478]
MKIEGTRIILTGASSGIGAGIADKLASMGAKLVLANRNKENGDKMLSELKAKYSTEVVFAATDMANLRDVKALHDFAISSFGGYDVLINNAGFGSKPFTQEIEDETDNWINTLHADYIGPIYLSRLAMSHWAKRLFRGVVINSGSTAGFGLHQDLSYGVSKSALHFATQTVDALLQRSENRAVANCCRMNTISIGAVFTDAFARRFKSPEDALNDKWWGRVIRQLGGWIPMHLMVSHYIQVILDDSIHGKVFVALGEKLIQSEPAPAGKYQLPMQALPERKTKL